MAETFIDDVRRFTEAVGCTTDRFNVRQLALYTGLQFEELAEKVEAVGFPDFARYLHQIGNQIKAGQYDDQIAKADRAKLLDADIDLAWVTIGAMLSQGADVAGACKEVARANLDKLVACDERHLGTDRPINECPKCRGTLLYAIKDDNGKVMKPEGWRAPDITPFVFKGE